MIEVIRVESPTFHKEIPTDQPASLASPAHPASEPELQARVQGFLVNVRIARCTIIGLPLFGLLTSIAGGLSFAAFLAAGFIIATSLVCGKAILTFSGQTLRLLVQARVVIVVMLSLVLFVTQGLPHNVIVSAVLSWLVADRLLGGRPLYQLWKLVTKR